MLHYYEKIPFEWDSGWFLESFNAHPLRPKLLSIREHPESNQICFELTDDATAQDKADIDQLAAAHDPMPLDRYKAIKNAAIDLRTRELIAEGFTYDGNTFSLSIPSQINWNMLDLQRARFTWPVAVSTHDDGEYSLAEANITTFWNTGKDTCQGHLDSGRALKVQVNAATDTAGVDAVNDAR